MPSGLLPALIVRAMVRVARSSSTISPTAAVATHARFPDGSTRIPSGTELFPMSPSTASALFRAGSNGISIVAIRARRFAS